jgi:hypothetical protein
MSITVDMMGATINTIVHVVIIKTVHASLSTMVRHNPEHRISPPFKGVR